MARVAAFMCSALAWTPSLGLNFLLPESKRFYSTYFTQQLFSQVVQVYAAALVFSILLPFVFFFEVETQWQFTFIAMCPFSLLLHLVALVVAHISPATKLFRRIDYVFVMMSLLTLVYLISGISLLNSFVTHLHASCFSLFIVVVTFYLQETFILSVFIILFFIANLMAIFIRGTRDLQGELLSGLYEQVKQV